MSASIKKLAGVLILAAALVPAILVAVPSAQAATVCDAGNPCLPQNAGFSSAIGAGSAGFTCSNAGGSAGYCVLVQNFGANNGLNGLSAGADGVYGSTNLNFTAKAGVEGYNGNTGPSAVGVRGSVAGSGYGGYFNAPGSNGWAVGAYGGYKGIDADGTTFGVDGYADGGANHAGVLGTISSNAANAAGVRGDNFSSSCCGMGVAGFHSGTGIGVYGEANNGFAVSGFSPNNWSGYFQGSVNVVGTLYKSSGAFRIDHPLDPAHKYLQHSFVESPDMMNVYNGNVTTNGKGFATVKLPAWFQALNKDFRYQLTVIDKKHWTARAAVWNKVSDNRFTIRTDQAHVQVSWQVTGVRHDAWASAHRLSVEVTKAADEQNKYVHPELYGKPMTKSVVVLPGMDGKGNSKLAPPDKK